LEIARSRDFPAIASGLFDAKRDLYHCNIAVAYDEAFNCYFPDTLDLLEYRGARIQDFSPLRDESLPPDTHVVYFGCGNLAAYAGELSRNYCFKQALRSYAAAGGRIYAECSGMAYLCEQIELPNRKPISMAGVLPAVAVRNEQAGPAGPVEVCLQQGCWLGPRGARLRGYGNQAWQLEGIGPLTHYAGDSLIGWQRAIGSRMHLNFAALPDYLDRFFRPLRQPMRATR
jgi:cobyrinic acid a,c-diamide synthase